MPRNVFSTTLDAKTLKALKLLAAREYRPLYEVLQEAAERYLAQRRPETPTANFSRSGARSRWKTAWLPSRDASPTSRGAVP